MTVEQGGSPELFQRGETYRGALLVDRQHPHDLFVELALRWERPLSRTTAFILYLSPWGEPAVGPTAYPHRLSASENPTAPLAHHNQDSTHISADVVTAGMRLAKVTLEGSAFHGREPDENRYDIDQGAIDSYSGRLTFRPTGGLAIQISAARRSPATRFGCFLFAGMPSISSWRQSRAASASSFDLYSCAIAGAAMQTRQSTSSERSIVPPPEYGVSR